MKNPKRLGGKKLTIINLILAVALIGSVAFVIYSSNKNKLKTKTESSKEKSVSQNSVTIDTNIPVAKTSETEETKKAELMGKDKEEVTFDQPIDVVWEGEIMATFVSGQDYGIKKIPEDKNFPYFYAGINSDAFPENVILEGNVEVTGKWIGITCAYQNTIFKRCVPEVEVQKITRTDPMKDWSEPYAFSVGDFSGDKIPDVLEETYTGGAHCCYDYKAYIKTEGGILEMPFDKSGPDEGVEIKDVNNDGVFELVGTGPGFNYWKASFADSPAPKIIASYDNNSHSFFLNLSLMKKPAPSQEEIKKKVEEANQNYDIVKNSDSEGLSPLVWRYMLDLIYSGNEKSAWEFFDQAWPKDVPGKEKFKAEFQQVFEASPNYEEIKKFNSGDNQTGKTNNKKEELQIISFKNGQNKIDLNFDGVQDIVFNSFRNSAVLPHDSAIYSFYIFKPKSDYGGDLWTIAQIFENPDDLEGKSDIEAISDVDCRLSDIRIVKTSDKKTYLIVAERDRKLFYYSDEPVNFKIYKLKENTEGNPNRPDYYFEKINTVKAKGEYCDVNEAMNAELDPMNKELTDVLN